MKKKQTSQKILHDKYEESSYKNVNVNHDQVSKTKQERIQKCIASLDTELRDILKTYHFGLLSNLLRGLPEDLRLMADIIRYKRPTHQHVRMTNEQLVDLLPWLQVGTSTQSARSQNARLKFHQALDRLHTSLLTGGMTTLETHHPLPVSFYKAIQCLSREEDRTILEAGYFGNGLDVSRDTPARKLEVLAGLTITSLKDDGSEHYAPGHKEFKHGGSVDPGWVERLTWDVVVGLTFWCGDGRVLGDLAKQARETLLEAEKQLAVRLTDEGLA
jgi:hypothetical protein